MSDTLVSLLLGLLGAGLLLFVGYSHGKRQAVLTVGPSAEEKKVNAETEKKVEAVQKKAEEEKKQAVEDHATEVAMVIDKEARETERKVADPLILNDYLKEIGKNVREP